jgi:hypothetical protein
LQGFYRSVDASCVRCPGGVPWTTFVGPVFVLALFAIYYSLNDAGGGSSSLFGEGSAAALASLRFSLQQAVLGAQYLSFSFAFFLRVEWPQWSLNLRNLFSFMDFSIDIAGPECVVTWTPGLRFVSITTPIGE